MLDAELSAARLAGLARELSECASEAEARELLVREAVASCGCAAAAFARARLDGAVELTWGGAAELVETLTRLIQPTGEPIAAAALAGQRSVTSADLAAEQRWPEYASALLRHSPIRSVRAHPIRLVDNDLAALVLYSDVTAEHPGGDGSRPTALFADHAAMGLSLLANRRKVEHLTIALENSREIGQAMGILMATHKVTADMAFDLLRTASQHGHLKLREVAKEVTLTGQLPQVASPTT